MYFTDRCHKAKIHTKHLIRGKETIFSEICLLSIYEGVREKKRLKVLKAISMGKNTLKTCILSFFLLLTKMVKRMQNTLLGETQ